MGIFTLRRRPAPWDRLCIISFDGVPFSFLGRHLDDGTLPHLGAVCTGGDLRRMRSVRPVVSTVAWATCMTGKNPGKHGLYGFIDRRPGSSECYLPDGESIRAPALWEVLSRAGRPVVVINVPATYPPRPVNGVLVSGFLCPSVDRVAYPPAVSARLAEGGYRIEADVRLGRTDRPALLADLYATLRQRFETARDLMRREPWDFFQLHVMETDRLNHFYWEAYEKGKGPDYEDFLGFYRALDALVGEFVAALPGEAGLVMLSDHGFCALRREVYLNRYLEERGWLAFEGRGARSLAGLSPEALAYSLIPGRVYLNLRGREPRGAIRGPDEYHGYREGLAADLMELTDPETGEPVVAEVLRGEEVNHNPSWGPFPVYPSQRDSAPCDLLVCPRNGYDLKGNFDRDGIFGRTVVTGMHTGDDAFVFVRGRRLREGTPEVVDIFPTVLDLLGVDTDEDIDGASLL